MTYDAIVVGARCAGAPTAMLLARRGYRILLVDAGRFPGDFPLSTHLIWQSGAARLGRWGLLDAVAGCGCPPIRRCDLDLGPMTLVGEPPGEEGVLDAYSPRRIALDQILLDAAIRAGVEFRERSRVVDLLRDDDQVTGIRAETDGAGFTETARIVIGADGPHSRVARSVDAVAYNTRPPLQASNAPPQASNSPSTRAL